MEKPETPAAWLSFSCAKGQGDSTLPTGHSTLGKEGVGPAPSLKAAAPTEQPGPLGLLTAPPPSGTPQLPSQGFPGPLWVEKSRPGKGVSCRGEWLCAQPWLLDCGQPLGLQGTHSDSASSEPGAGRGCTPHGNSTRFPKEAAEAGRLGHSPGGSKGERGLVLRAALSPRQRPHSRRRPGPGCADPFSAWSCPTRRTPSRAARGRSRSRPTAACSCRCGRGARRGGGGRA